MENTHGWQISEEDKKRIIDEAVCSWNKYCEALKTHNNNSFTRDEVKSLMGIVHDSGQKEIASLQSEIDRLKEERQELVKAVKAFVDLKTTSVNGFVLVDANNKAEREAIQNLITRIK